MPEISRFLGIVIQMFYADHGPPHFHAVYGDHRITVDIETGEAHGRFPRRALALVLEWHVAHQDALRDDWERATRREPLAAIPPLE